MSLEKITCVDKIEIVEGVYVQIRARTNIIENGKTISSSFERRVICPGENYSNEDDLVKKICSVVHAEDVVLKFKQLKGN